MDVLDREGWRCLLFWTEVSVTAAGDLGGVFSFSSPSPAPPTGSWLIWELVVKEGLGSCRGVRIVCLHSFTNWFSACCPVYVHLLGKIKAESMLGESVCGHEARISVCTEGSNEAVLLMLWMRDTPKSHIFRRLFAELVILPCCASLCPDASLSVYFHQCINAAFGLSAGWAQNMHVPQSHVIAATKSKLFLSKAGFSGLRSDIIYRAWKHGGSWWVWVDSLCCHHWSTCNRSRVERASFGFWYISFVLLKQH